MASKVSLNRDYTKSLANSPHPLLCVAKLGMGTSNTWHGIPDARIRTSYRGNTNVIATNTDNYTSSDGDSIVRLHLSNKIFLS